MALETGIAEQNLVSISAGLAGVAGVLYAHNLTTLTALPKNFGYNMSIMILVYVVLGGIGSIRGSVIATVILYLLPEMLRGLSNYRMLMYAIVLIVVIRFRPSGILGWYMNSKVKTFIDEKILKKPSLDVLEEYELMADKGGK